MGMAGGTDVHNSLTSIEEDNFFGKHVDQEPRPDRWSGVSKKGLGFTRYNWQYTAAGYTRRLGHREHARRRCGTR